MVQWIAFPHDLPCMEKSKKCRHIFRTGEGGVFGVYNIDSKIVSGLLVTL